MRGLRAPPSLHAQHLGGRMGAVVKARIMETYFRLPI
jgi:hypothetical protein